MNELKIRDSYWDVVKGVLILLVILGHVIQYGVGGDFWHHLVFRSIYTFHMPLFMLVSGYFAWNGVHGGISWPVRRIRQLLLTCMMVPFLLAAAFALIAFRHGDEARMIAAFKRCTFPSLWYLCVLLECSIFGWLMFRCRALWWRAVWVILPVIVALAIPYTGRFNVVVIRLFPHGGCFLFLWPFFLIGLMMRWGGRLSAGLAPIGWC